MYSPEDIFQARARASFHLELLIERTEAGTALPGQSVIHGRVTRMFRGPETMKMGDSVLFPVDSQDRGQRFPPGDDVRLMVQDLMPGEYLEAYFTPNGRLCSGVWHLEVALRQARVYSTSSPMARL